MAFFMNTLVHTALAAIGFGTIYGWSNGILTPVNAGLIGAVTGLLHTFGVLKGLLRWVLSGILLNVITLGAVLAYIKIYWTQPLTKEEQERKEVDFQTAQTKGDITPPKTHAGGLPSVPPKLRSTTALTVMSKDRPIASFMTIRRTFDVAGKETSAPTVAAEAERSSQGAVKAVKEAWSNSKESPAAQALAAQAGGGQVPAATMSSKAYSMFTSAYKNIQDRSASPSGPGGSSPKTYIQASDYTKDMWIKLDGNILFIYDDETMSNPRGAIPISEYTVTISNGSSKGSPRMKEGELFNKKNAIVLTPPTPSKRALRERTASSDSARLPTRKNTKSSLGGKSVTESIAGSSAASITGSEAGDQAPTRPRASSTASSVVLTAEEEAEARRKRQERKEREQRRAQAEAQPYYLFVKNPAKMEFWYHRLLQVSSKPPTKREIFPLASWAEFVDELESSADPSQMRGINAFLGRLFCGYSQTAIIEALIVNKIHTKIRKSQVHWMAGEITVREFVVGTHPPRFSKMVLKEITKEGGITLQVDLKYEGEMSVHIGTQAQLSMGFKRVGLNVEAKATLRSISGTLLIKINPPPSNRLWYAFTTTPSMDLRVEPIISATKLAYPAVLGQIDKLIRSAIDGAIVMPNMDDLSFFDSSALDDRGGIFDAAARTKDGIPVNNVATSDTTGPSSATIDKQSSLGASATAPIGSAIGGESPKVPRDSLSGGTGTGTDSIAAQNGADTSAIHRDSLSSTSRNWFGPRAGTSSESLGSTSSGLNGNLALPAVGSRPATPAPSTSDSLPGQESLPMADSAAPGSLQPVPAVDPSIGDIVESPVSTTESRLGGASTIQPAPSGHRTASSTSSVTAAEAWSHAKQDTLNGTSAAALMNTLRAKAADKEALQTSVNQARDAMKKWGTGWAAKHRNFAIPAREISEEAEQRGRHPPPAPTESHVDPIGSQPIQTNKSTDPFQQRLAAAALLATSPERTKMAQPQSTPAMAVPRIPKRPLVDTLDNSSVDLGKAGDNPDRAGLDKGPTATDEQVSGLMSNEIRSGTQGEAMATLRGLQESAEVDSPIKVGNLDEVDQSVEGDS